MRAASTCVGIVVLLLAGARPADAGRSRFGWLYDVDTVPERSVELETWIFEENGANGRDDTTLWWAPVIGITDQLELALPIELVWSRPDGAPASTQLSRVGAEVRWRLVTADPVEAPAFVPLLRLGVKRLLDDRDGLRLEPGVVLGLDLGRFHLGVDVGAFIVEGDASYAELRAGLGASVAIDEDLRLGAEGYVAWWLRGDGEDWLVVGPNLSWTHGRFWLTLAVPIGVHQIDAAPRLNWAIAF